MRDNAADLTGIAMLTRPFAALCGVLPSLWLCLFPAMADTSTRDALAAHFDALAFGGMS
ncbi:hypothetical protein [Natronohydrobacter thiooxidans]|uniref:hypothetical protein n=1 Tax=Natronohydrobacter thiooxidans TaxID=87172 RepID=UPI001FE73243|nr:hypothetical protein [Natronohydrobacter thiooxidans]